MSSSTLHEDVLRTPDVRDELRYAWLPFTDKERNS